MMTPRQYLLSLNKPYITLPDCAKSLGLDTAGLHYRVHVSPQEERPENNGGFKAGGLLCFVCDTGIAWVERHEKYWADRQSKRSKANREAS